MMLLMMLLSQLQAQKCDPTVPYRVFKAGATIKGFCPKTTSCIGVSKMLPTTFWAKPVRTQNLDDSSLSAITEQHVKRKVFLAYIQIYREK